MGTAMAMKNISRIALALLACMGLQDAASAQQGSGIETEEQSPRAAGREGILEELSPTDAERFRAFSAGLARRRAEALYSFADVQELGSRGNLALLLLDLDAASADSLLSLLAVLSSEQAKAVASEMDLRPVANWKGMVPLVQAIGPDRAAVILADPYAAGRCDRPAGGTPEMDPVCMEEERLALETWGYGGHMVSVTHGEVAPIGAAPWQVQLLFIGESAKYAPADAAKDKANYGFLLPAWERNHLCGGSYIGEGWVLTAAHCIGTFRGVGTGDDFFARRAVRMGTQDIRHGGSVWNIDAVVVHRKYDGNAAHGYDIALVRLAREPSAAELATMKVRRIDLPQATDPKLDGQQLEVTGWGLTGVTSTTKKVRADDGSLQRRPNLLQLGRLIYVSPGKCRANPGLRSAGVTFLAGELCAGSADQIDACQGDSGGPLTWRHGSQSKIVGIVSFGKGCGLKDVPGVYTDVLYFVPWIKGAMTKPVKNRVVAYPGM